jgi:hypothetical protein
VVPSRRSAERWLHSMCRHRQLVESEIFRIVAPSTRDYHSFVSRRSAYTRRLAASANPPASTRSLDAFTGTDTQSLLQWVFAFRKAFLLVIAKWPSSNSTKQVFVVFVVINTRQRCPLRPMGSMRSE